MEKSDDRCQRMPEIRNQESLTAFDRNFQKLPEIAGDCRRLSEISSNNCWRMLVAGAEEWQYDREYERMLEIAGVFCN